MRTSSVNTLPILPVRLRTLPLSTQRALGWAALFAIVALAAVLRFDNLSSLGYANHYYAAAVKSMLQSWHNFFFVAAEPGASVSIDKPPLGLWLQAISAAVFGVNGFALLLPQILAGITSIVVLYHLVQRSFGTVAGLLAALTLAITPVVIATDRNNTMDSTLILSLLLAAWAFIKATETGKTRLLLLGALLVGLGFNIKMLAAYLPLPAFFALYFLGSFERLRRKLWKLAAATGLLLMVSLAWAVVVDLTPASQRPYVGSSGNNSALNLIVGYNGLDRLEGMRPGGGAWNGGFAAGNPRPPQTGANNAPPPRTPGGGFTGRGNNFRPTGNGAPSPQGDGGLRGGGGMNGVGRAGALRLFTTPLNKEMSWLLPFGLFGALLVLLGTRLRWPLASRHQALVLWGGWLLTGGVFFSVAGFFHEYYLAILAAPLAALFALGIHELWQISKRRLWLAALLLLAAADGTLIYQVFIANSFVNSIPWLPLMIILFAAGALPLIIVTIYSLCNGSQVGATPDGDLTPENSPKTGPQRSGADRRLRNLRPITVTGFTCVIAAMLLTPAMWSGLTNQYASANQSLPAAYGGQSGGYGRLGGLQVNSELLAFLQEHTRDNTYLMAVPSSMQGADYVLATGRPVLYLGGFMGQDQVVSSAELQQMVSRGELRYIYWGGNRGGRMGAQPDITAWVSAQCSAVSGFETATRNAGAPDGTTAAAAGPGMGDMQVTLYDCGV